MASRKVWVENFKPIETMAISIPATHPHNIPRLSAMYNIIRTLCFLFLFLPLAHAQTQVVAKVSFVRGSQVTAEHLKETARPLAQGSEIYLGDTIKTPERSFVIIEFIDGAKMTVRPNSLFSINHYDNQSINKGALMVLHQGGVHATTGEIAKQQPEKFQIKTDTMMVKAQPADYSVQLCEHNCKQEADNKEVVAARIVELKGVVSAKNETSPMRTLSLGDALYSTDIVSSQADSYALLVFADGEKITLQAGSQLHIKQYSYHSDIQQDRALFSLIKGGMRVLTGLIGKENPKAYNVGTPVATIGIRGTGFDLFCTGDCVAKNNVDMKAIEQGLAEGLYCYVWQGEINLYNKSGNLLLATSNSAYIGSSTSELLTLSQPPEILLHSPAPRPDGHNVDLKQLFPTKTSRTMPTGLYISVHNGHVKLESVNQEGKIAVHGVLHDNELGYMSVEGQFTRNVLTATPSNTTTTDNDISAVVSSVLDTLKQQPNTDNPATANAYLQLIHNVQTAADQHVITQTAADTLINTINVMRGINVVPPTPPSPN